jgi:hypothetical protein
MQLQNWSYFVPLLEGESIVPMCVLSFRNENIVRLFESDEFSVALVWQWDKGPVWVWTCLLEYMSWEWKWHVTYIAKIWTVPKHQAWSEYGYTGPVQNEPNETAWWKLSSHKMVGSEVWCATWVSTETLHSLKINRVLKNLCWVHG